MDMVAMWRLAVLVLAAAHSWAAAIAPAEPIPASDVHVVRHLQPEGFDIARHASKVESPMDASHALLPVMRREEVGASVLEEHGRITTADLLKRDVRKHQDRKHAEVNDGDKWDLHAADVVAEADNAERMRKAGQDSPEVVDSMSAFMVFLGLGAMPSSQIQAFSVLALLLVLACGFTARYLYNKRLLLEQEEHAAFRRKVLKIRAAAAAGLVEGKAPALALDKPGTERQDPSLATGLGGKAAGKAYGKGGGKAPGKSSGKISSKAVGKGVPDQKSLVARLLAFKDMVTGGAEIDAKSSKLGGKAVGKGKGASGNAAPAPGISALAAKAPLAGAAGLGFGHEQGSPSIEILSSASSSAPSLQGSSQLDGVESVVSERSAVASLKSSSFKTGKGCGTKDGATKSQDLYLMLRAVGKIQSMWRRWKACQRMPSASQRITFVCDIFKGAAMPNVNRFGGCDPFIECRIVRGDPTYLLRGDVDKAPLLTAQTDVKRNDMAPNWNQRLTLPDLIYENDLYVQLVLWDYNLMRNHPVGHVALPLERALGGHGLRHPDRPLTFSTLPGCEEIVLNATVSAGFSFWDEYRHRLVVVAGSWLPKVKMLGTISSYVEAQVLNCDPRKVSSAECLWSSRTRVVSDNVDPNYDQEFDFVLSCDPSLLWLQLVLWDSNSDGPDVPIGHSVVKMSQANQASSAADLMNHQVRLEELPDRHVAADLSRAKLTIRLGCEPVSSMP